jgi:hypothetical protein
MHDLMNARRPLLLFIAALLSGLAFMARAEDSGEACHYRRPKLDAAAPADRPRFKRSGEVELADGIKVPAYSLSMVSGGMAEGGRSKYTPGKRGPKITIPSEMAGRLEAYATPMGTIVVPKGWTPRRAAEGADGSFLIYFAPDTSGQSYLSVENTAACVGCAYSAASRYFESARKLAKDDGFMYCSSAESVHSVTLNPFQRSYEIKPVDGNPVDGLAYFNPGDDLMFYEVEVSAPGSEHALASAVLNQFVIPKKK